MTAYSAGISQMTVRKTTKAQESQRKHTGRVQKTTNRPNKHPTTGPIEHTVKTGSPRKQKSGHKGKCQAKDRVTARSIVTDPTNDQIHLQPVLRSPPVPWLTGRAGSAVVRRKVEPDGQCSVRICFVCSHRGRCGTMMGCGARSRPESWV